jgi:hypothetical protein
VAAGLAEEGSRHQRRALKPGFLPYFLRRQFPSRQEWHSRQAKIDPTRRGTRKIELRQGVFQGLPHVEAAMN